MILGHCEILDFGGSVSPYQLKDIDCFSIDLKCEDLDLDSEVEKEKKKEGA